MEKTCVSSSMYRIARKFIKNMESFSLTQARTDDLEKAEALEKAADIHEAKLALKEIKEKGSIPLKEMENILNKFSK